MSVCSGKAKEKTDTPRAPPVTHVKDLQEMWCYEKQYDHHLHHTFDNNSGNITARLHVSLFSDAKL